MPSWRLILAMQDTCQALLDEYRSLDALCTTLGASQWGAASAFYGWSAWDEIAHLCYFDETGLLAVTDPVAFAWVARALLERTDRGEEISAIARYRFGHLEGPALTAFWRSRYEPLVQALCALDPKARLPWYGPSMSARSFATARLMETWAHGQDIWDVLCRPRPPGAGLRHIAHLGVTTYGWTFVNRGLPVPVPVPFVELHGPGGAVWTWGEPSTTDFVRGPAQDFCLVVTQRRHVDDTALQLGGESAHQWLGIAQCFAGPPADGPPPGQRRLTG